MPFQTHSDFRHPTRIVHGPGSIACLADCFSPADKVLIVSDQVLGEIGIVEAVVAALGDIPHAVYLKDGSSEPTEESVEAGAQTYQQERCTAIIGLGGGSPMDVAKMIGVLASNAGRITSIWAVKKSQTTCPTSPASPRPTAPPAKSRPSPCWTIPPAATKIRLLAGRSRPNSASSIPTCRSPCPPSSARLLAWTP